MSSTQFLHFLCTLAFWIHCKVFLHSTKLGNLLLWLLYSVDATVPLTTAVNKLPVIITFTTSYYGFLFLCASVSTSLQLTVVLHEHIVQLQPAPGSPIYTVHFSIQTLAHAQYTSIYSRIPLMRHPIIQHLRWKVPRPEITGPPQRHNQKSFQLCLYIKFCDISWPLVS
jgi:hypothetical protein